MKKKYLLLLLLFVGIFILQGCSQNLTETSNACKKYDQTIGLVTDIGGIDDKSFNQGTWEGIQSSCEEYQTGAKVIESSLETDYVPNIKNISEQEGIKTVILAGENFANAVYEVAPEFPDIKYIVIDAIPKDKNGKEVELDNVKSYLFKEQEAGYLVGYIAGKITTTDKLGFIGGMEVGPVQRFGWGYVQGINDANPKAEVAYNYSGTFSDPTKGNQIAQAMYDSGVDIIFSAAGATNDGVLNSAKTVTNNQQDAWVIGVDRDMYDAGLYQNEKSVVLTSALKQVGEAAKLGIESVMNKNFTSGVEILGYQEEGVGIPDKNPNINDITVIEEAKNHLETIKVVDTLEETQQKVKNLKIEGTL